MSVNSSTMSTTVTAGTIVATTAGVLMILRAIKRRSSPIISSKLKCRCGKVKGEIRAKTEDSIRLHCYCKDCQNYAHYIAKLGGGEEKSPMVYACGETHLVQVCKNAFSIMQGNEHFQLARKNKDMGMHRYYASCCNTPICNTIENLGFVGVFEDNMDSEREKFLGPFSYATENATKTPLENVAPGAQAHRFIWNLLRYQPWRKAGPFDYSLKPVFWGEGKKEA